MCVLPAWVSTSPPAVLQGSVHHVATFRCVGASCFLLVVEVPRLESERAPSHPIHVCDVLHTLPVVLLLDPGQLTGTPLWCPSTT